MHTYIMCEYIYNEYVYIFAHAHVHVHANTTYINMHTCYFVFVDPSGPPLDLMLLASGPSTLLVSWSVPSINPEVVLEYVIRRTRQSNASDTIYNCEVFTRSMFGDSPAATASAMTPPRESKI